MRLLAGLALVGCIALTGCGNSDGGSVLAKKTLTVGIRTDLPGIGMRVPSGDFAGLDVDVSRYVARQLRKTARFVAVQSAERERMIIDGRIDLAPTYWVLPKRKLRLAFAGPYLQTYQDILVRADERAIAGVRDLKGRKLCAVSGAEAAEQVIQERRVAAVPVPAQTYDQCISMLKDGVVDAITTNDTILAGFKVREGDRVRLVNARFGERRTGIAMRKADPDGCEAVNRAITQMHQDGTAARLLHKWFAGTGLDLSLVAVPQFEGCL